MGLSCPHYRLFSPVALYIGTYFNRYEDGILTGEIAPTSSNKSGRRGRMERWLVGARTSVRLCRVVSPKEIADRLERYCQRFVGRSIKAVHVV